MNSFAPVITVDTIANSAYIKLSEEGVRETSTVTDEVLVDLDQNGVVVGVEVLGLDARIPFTTLTEQYHVHSTVIALLQTIQPSVGGFVSKVTQGADGSARTESGEVEAATR